MKGLPRGNFRGLGGILCTVWGWFADTTSVLRLGQMLQLLVMALLGLGVVMVHSAGGRVGVDSSLGSVLQMRQGIYALVALTVMMVCSRLDVRSIFLERRGMFGPMTWFVLLSLGCVLGAWVPGVGRSVNGAARWIYLGPRQWGLSFQPSEIAKMMMVFAIAWWCTRRGGVMHRFGRGLLPPLLLMGLTCLLILLEDLGTAVLIGTVGVVLLVAGGARIWHLLLMVPLAGAALVAAVMQSPYRVARLMAFMDPWADSSGTGYHPIQSMLAIAMGGPLGRGLGGGIQKFGYLPEDTTDFIFAVICEELGLGGACLVALLFATLLWVCLAIARQCRDPFGRLLALGILLTVGFQAVMNLMVVTVLVPTKGIALPLISAGGTGWVITAAGLGIIASLDYAYELEHDEYFELAAA